VFRLGYRPIEIVIVDNGSVDTSPRLLEELVTKTTPSDIDVKMIRLSRNRGFTGGNLAGFEAVSEDSKYLAVINNDVFCDNNSLEKLVDALEVDKGVAAVTGKLLTWDRQRIDGMGCFTSQLGNSYNLGHTLKPESCSKEIPVTAVGGAYAVYRISSVKECGGLFIPEFFFYSEDMELGIRLWRHGFKSKSIPVVVGKHFSSATTRTTTQPKSFPWTEYTEWRNRTMILLLYEKMWGLSLILGLPYILATTLAKRTSIPLTATIRGIVLGLKLKKKYKNMVKNTPHEPIVRLRIVNWYTLLLRMWLRYGARGGKIAYAIISRALHKPESCQELFWIQRS
jgi:GT2 family glycosyltransferase